MHRLVPDQAKAEHCRLFTFLFFLFFFFREKKMTRRCLPENFADF